MLATVVKTFKPRVDTNLWKSKKTEDRAVRSLPRFTVTSRNLCKVSLSNPQISMKLRSNAAAIFPSWNCDVGSRGRALSFQTFKETGHRDAGGGGEPSTTIKVELKWGGGGVLVLSY